MWCLGRASTNKTLEMNMFHFITYGWIISCKRHKCDLRQSWPLTRKATDMETPHARRMTRNGGASQPRRTAQRWMSALWSLWLVLAVCTGAVAAGEASYATMPSRQIHGMLRDLYVGGRFVELERVAQQVIEENPGVVQERTEHTTVYEFLGVAQYLLGDLEKAVATFERAVEVNDDDVKSWVQLGNCYLYKLELAKSIRVLETAVYEKGATDQVHQLFKARNWIADWRDYDELLEYAGKKFRDDISREQNSGAAALDYVGLDSKVIKKMAALHSRTDAKPNDARCCSVKGRELELRSQRLRVGFVSSDFGIHPVVTLMRGLLEVLAQDDDQQVVVYCFALTTATSWWKRNITRTVDHMISLAGKNPDEAATVIHSHGIHVLIDLNGHTLHSGLSIFAYRPSPIQISFLGYPMTTGDPSIDFFVSDRVSTPPEMSSDLFTEKLLLLPTNYIANDHAQMMGHTLEGKRPALMKTDPEVDGDAFVFATFSNWQKMDPFIFSAWMAIMARVPKSVMWFIRSSGHVEAAHNLRQEAFAHGIDGDRRLVFSDYQPWLHHTHGKRAADLVLDTSLKNGHTTMIDALFAGVPIITLEGNRMSNRAGSSALHAIRMQELTVNSIKEYVELAVEVATNRDLLERLRATTEQHRLAFPLFDTRYFASQFSSALRSAWHVGKRQRQRNRTEPAPPDFRAMHIFPAVVDETNLSPRFFEIHNALDDDELVDPYEERVRASMERGEEILLHIGGQQRRSGWWIVDIEDRENVDFPLPMDKLYPFPDNSVTSIYASHVLEHVNYGVEEDVRRTLEEWNRVLAPGGSLLVAVPDLSTLSSLFINETLTEQDRFSVMRMMFGGQVNAFDVHKVGFNLAFLAIFLQNAGFCEIQRVENFNLFADASMMAFYGVPISLNVMAKPCKISSSADATRTTR